MFAFVFPKHYILSLVSTIVSNGWLGLGMDFGTLEAYAVLLMVHEAQVGFLCCSCHVANFIGICLGMSGQHLHQPRIAGKV